MTEQIGKQFILVFKTKFYYGDRTFGNNLNRAKIYKRECDAKNAALASGVRKDSLEVKPITLQLINANNEET